MPGFPKALLVSAVAHAALAAALCVCLDKVRKAPSLDLSAVEISFADADSAETPPSLPSPPPPRETSDPPPEPPQKPPPEEPVPPSEPPPALPPEEPVPPPEPPQEPRPEEPVPLPEPPPAPPPEESAPPPEPPQNPPPEESAPPLPEPPPPSAPMQARIDAPPRPLRSIRPDYPKNARQRGEEGDVVLALSIDERGRVSRAEVAATSGFPELDAAAVRAAERARFSPAKSGRSPVASTARVTITFRLK